MNEQTAAAAIPEVLVEKLLGMGMADEKIAEQVRQRCQLSEADAQECIGYMRQHLAGLTRKSDAEHQADARRVYALVKRDPASNNSQKMRAQQHLDELLGLADRYAAMHAGGQDDADVIEALAFYRSMLWSPQANIAQRLRAQSALDRLRRLVNKKTADDAPVASDPPAETPAPATTPPPATTSMPAPTAAAAPSPEIAKTIEKPRKSLVDKSLPSPAALLPARKRTPRNARCPCGSGRKYKTCCGAPKPASSISA